MKTWTKVLLGGAALAVVAGGVAVADGPRWRDGSGKWGRGHGASAEMMFGRFDANRDGTVTIEEVLVRPDARFDAVDANKDGTIDKAEMDAAIQKRVAEIRDRILARLDTDKDGNLTKAEAEKPFRKRFAVFDENDDGKVTREEMRANMPPFAGGMGGHGHHGMRGMQGMDGMRGPMMGDGPGRPGQDAMPRP